MTEVINTAHEDLSEKDLLQDFQHTLDAQYLQNKQEHTENITTLPNELVLTPPKKLRDKPLSLNFQGQNRIVQYKLTGAGQYARHMLIDNEWYLEMNTGYKGPSVFDDLYDAKSQKVYNSLDAFLPSQTRYKNYITQEGPGSYANCDTLWTQLMNYDPYFQGYITKTSLKKYIGSKNIFYKTDIKDKTTSAQIIQEYLLTREKEGDKSSQPSVILMNEEYDVSENDPLFFEAHKSKTPFDGKKNPTLSLLFKHTSIKTPIFYYDCPKLDVPAKLVHGKLFIRNANTPGAVVAAFAKYYLDEVPDPNDQGEDTPRTPDVMNIPDMAVLHELSSTGKIAEAKSILKGSFDKLYNALSGLKQQELKANIVASLPTSANKNLPLSEIVQLLPSTSFKTLIVTWTKMYSFEV